MLEGMNFSFLTKGICLRRRNNNGSTQFSIYAIIHLFDIFQATISTSNMSFTCYPVMTLIMRKPATRSKRMWWFSWLLQFFGFHHNLARLIASLSQRGGLEFWSSNFWLPTSVPSFIFFGTKIILECLLCRTQIRISVISQCNKLINYIRVC